MAENSIQIRNALNGYNKEEVKRVLKNNEAELQRRAVEIDSLQQEIKVLEAQLEAARTPEAVEAAEKIELYEKLMAKMDGDFRKILGPAQAKAKAIELKATSDYEMRMDQARATADGIYELAADRIVAVVDQNMDRLYNLLDEFIYSKSLAGRVESFIRTCDKVSLKLAAGIVAAAKIPGKAYTAVSGVVQEKVEEVKSKVDEVKAKVESFKQSRMAEDAVEDEEVAFVVDAEEVIAEEPVAEVEEAVEA